MNSENHLQEFQKQIDTLINKDYPKIAGISKEEFLLLVEPLKDLVTSLPATTIDIENGYIPFVMVVKNNLIPTDKAMSLIDKDGKQGITKLFPLEPKDFHIIDAEKIPDEMVYLLIDIDRGKESINLPPNEAMQHIRNSGRHPLTIDEGIAILTHYPEFLMKNNCFSLLASRHSGDKRVPALWINAQKQPNLGWCWDGNPHTWLGSASCKSRVGIAE